jgi:hypothetical protein
MTVEELISKLKDLENPKSIDPYWADDPGWYLVYIEALRTQIEEEGIQ